MGLNPARENIVDLCFGMYVHKSACVPEMAICWILNWMLMEGFSSGLEAPVCRLMVPLRLGSFWGLILPTSQLNSCTTGQGVKNYFPLN